jgi:hypothetical protein
MAPLHRPKNPQGGWFEQSTDPASDSANGVDNQSKWVDTSTSPPTSRIRNSGNTAWVAEVAITILGSFTDTFVLTTGQTTATTTHTPASQADITPSMGQLLLDPSQITGLAGKVVTFNAIPAALNGKTLSLEYTRID